MMICMKQASGTPHYVDVTIYIPEQWPSDKELDARNKIIESLDEQKIGNWTDAGSGMGTVEFSYLTEQNLDKVRKIVSTTIEKYLPGYKYVISFSEYVEHPGSDANYKPIFEPGTCLSVKLYPGGYGTAIVLNVDSGYTLVGGLKGIYETLPTMEICKKKDWLYLTHHNYRKKFHMVWCDDLDYPESSHLFKVVGKVELSEKDPKADFHAIGVPHGSWDVIENQIWLQDNWDKGIR